MCVFDCKFITCSHEVTEGKCFLEYHRASVFKGEERVRSQVTKSHLVCFQLVAYYLVTGDPAHAKRLLQYKLGAESSKPSKAIINSNQASLSCIQYKGLRGPLSFSDNSPLVPITSFNLLYHSSNQAKQI